MTATDLLGVALIAATLIWTAYVVRDTIRGRWSHEIRLTEMAQTREDTQCTFRQEVIDAHAAHDATKREYVTDRERYELAMREHERRLRDVEQYVQYQRAPSAPGRRAG